MSIVEHAKREFEILGWPSDCEMQKEICDGLLEMLEVFSKQGHSGSSANYALGLFSKLSRFDPISPLTGADQEWSLNVGGAYQNIRDGAVFKDSKKGQAYWIDGKIFCEPDGSCYTSKDSRVFIGFPWVKPKPEMVQVLKGE